MAVPKAERQLQKNADQVLAPGEHLVAAVRALAVGAFEGRLGMAGEMLTGAVMQTLLTGESVRRAHRAQFPAAPRMVVAMTDRRFLVWRAPLFSHKAARLLGEVPMARVASVTFQPHVDPRRVTFAFVDAPPVSITAYKRDHPERLAESFRRRYEAPVSEAPAAEPAAEVPAPEALPAGVREETPVAVAAQPMPVLTVVPAMASATPPFPPPPPLAPARPPRPAANSWAVSLPLRGTQTSEGEGQPAHEKKCIQCGTINPEAAAFCWRCYVPFGQPQMATRAPAPKPASQSPLIAGVLDSGVRTSLSWGAAPAPIKTRYRRGLLTKVAILAVAVAVGVAAYGGAREAWARYSRTHVTVPAAIAGMTRIDDPRLQTYVQQLENLAQQSDMTAKAAFYGFSGSPRFYFAAFEYRRPANESPEYVFGEFARGYASSGFASIDVDAKTTDRSQEATYICAPVKAKVRGSICMWADRDIVGFVQASRQSVQMTHDLTAVVRFSVES